MSDSKTPLGFIGLGVMGEPICRNLVRKSGHPVYVTDINAEPVTRIGALGGRACTSIIEVANKRDVNLIGLDEASLATLSEKYSFYVPVTVPAGTYNGMTEDVTVPAVSAVLICKKDLGEDLVYQLTKVLFEKTGDLTHAKKELISAESAVKGVPVPFHPGAEKYFSELGLLG